METWSGLPTFFVAQRCVVDERHLGRRRSFASHVGSSTKWDLAGRLFRPPAPHKDPPSRLTRVETQTLATTTSNAPAGDRSLPGGVEPFRFLSLLCRGDGTDLKNLDEKAKNADFLAWQLPDAPALSHTT